MRILILALFLLTGCVSRKYSAEPREDGLYQLKTGIPYFDETAGPEAIVRDEHGHLVTEAAAATARTGDLTRKGEDVMVIPECSYRQFHRAKVAEYEARAALQRREFSQALAKLDAAEAVCPGVHRITAQDYLRAMAYAGLNRMSEARAAAQRFLQESATDDPAVYQQGDGPGVDEDRARYAEARERFAQLRTEARAFVATGKPLAWKGIEDPVAKLPPNSFFRPGSNQRTGGLVLPIVQSGGPYGSSFGAGGYYSWGHFGAGVSFAAGSLGNLFGVRLRESLYESPSRDWNVETFISGFTSKTYSYKYDGRYYSDFHVKDTAFDVSAGLGATKRWTLSFGVSGGGSIGTDRLNQRARFSGTLYTFYDVWNESGPLAGYVANQPVVAWSFYFLSLGYNLKDQGIYVFQQGAMF